MTARKNLERENEMRLNQMHNVIENKQKEIDMINSKM